VKGNKRKQKILARNGEKRKPLFVTCPLGKGGVLEEATTAERGMGELSPGRGSTPLCPSQGEAGEGPAVKEGRKGSGGRNGRDCGWFLRSVRAG